MTDWGSFADWIGAIAQVVAAIATGVAALADMISSRQSQKSVEDSARDNQLKVFTEYSLRCNELANDLGIMVKGTNQFDQLTDNDKPQVKSKVNQLLQLFSSQFFLFNYVDTSLKDEWRQQMKKFYQDKSNFFRYVFESSKSQFSQDFVLFFETEIQNIKKEG
jgi:hypothetical protein